MVYKYQTYKNIPFQIKSSIMIKFFLYLIQTLVNLVEYQTVNNTPAFLCERLALQFCRNRLYRHDFLALYRQLQANLYLNLRYPVPIYKALISQQRTYLKKLDKFRTEVICIPVYTQLPQSSETFIGGGTSELSSFLPQNNSSNQYEYTFDSYVLENQVDHIIYKQSDLIATVDLSLDVIVPFLSIPVLKSIAKSHKISFNSKVKSEDLKKLIYLMYVVIVKSIRQFSRNIILRIKNNITKN